MFILYPSANDPLPRRKIKGINAVATSKTCLGSVYRTFGSKEDFRLRLSRKGCPLDESITGSSGFGKKGLRKEEMNAESDA
jgi:hypothetical protein